MDAEIPDGHIVWSEPWRHTAGNTGDAEIKAIIVESKDRAYSVDRWESGSSQIRGGLLLPGYGLRS